MKTETDEFNPKDQSITDKPLSFFGLKPKEFFVFVGVFIGVILVLFYLVGYLMEKNGTRLYIFFFSLFFVFLLLNYWISKNKYYPGYLYDFYTYSKSKKKIDV